MAMSDAISDDTQANNRLSERLRSGLALAQTRIQTMETRAKSQWTDLPAQLRGAVDRAVALLRTTLDLPSRSDVSELVERLEALDRKMAALEKRQGKRAAGAEVETPAPVEAAASAAPATEQRAGEAEDQREPEANDDGKTTARKTVKSTSAGKTVKAGAGAGRANDKHGAGKRKKGHRNGQRA